MSSVNESNNNTERIHPSRRHVRRFLTQAKQHRATRFHDKGYGTHATQSRPLHQPIDLTDRAPDRCRRRALEHAHGMALNEARSC